MFKPKTLLQALGLLSLLALVSAPPILAQEAEPTGTVNVVVADSLGEPIEGVLVQVLDPSRSVMGEARTDADGAATFTGLAHAYYEIRVMSPIHTDVYRVVEVHEEPVPLEVVLRPAGIEEKVTVTASRGTMAEASTVAATIRAIDDVELQARAANLLPRMLDEEPGILTQQTTPGQGSPILRGQSAQGVLYLVDGMRYNNATYRAGNTQYLAWIPDSGVESIEAQLGPAAVGYGSDALGGAINVLTPPVPGYAAQGTRFNGSFRVFGESATGGGGGSLTGGLAGQRLSGYVTLSGARQGDMRAGRGEDSHHVTVSYLGFTQEQVQEIFGSRLVDTGFGQAGVTGKAALRMGESGSLSAFFTGSEQYDVRRYDRLLGGQGRVRADFTPQRLGFGYFRYQTHFNETFLNATVSYNRQVDGRVDQRRLTSPLAREESDVRALGLESTASTVIADHLLAFGLEIYREKVDAFESETAEGVTRFVRPRYPNGARYTSFGAFVTDEWGLLGDRLQLSGGLRFSAFRYEARAEDNIIDGVARVQDATETASDFTFDAGAIFSATDDLALWARMARGFRAPSIFDFGQLGVTGGGFEVSPAEAVELGALVGDSAGPGATSTGIRWSGLQPEVLWSWEGGLRVLRDDLRFELTAFTSEFSDFISRRAVIVDRSVVGRRLGGQTIVAQDDFGRIYVPADSGPVVSRANIGALRVWGLETLFQKPFADNWRATVKASLQRGEELDTGFFAEKVAPDNLTAILRWRGDRGNLWLEGVVRGALTQDRFNPEDLADTRVGAFRTPGDIADFFLNQGPRLGLVRDGILLETGETLEQVIARVLPNGAAPLFTETPGWLTLGIRGSWSFQPGHTLMFAVHNVTDVNYRFHGSGFDALGINATVAYTADF